jgi:hypothetical protein
MEKEGVCVIMNLYVEIPYREAVCNILLVLICVAAIGYYIYGNWREKLLE